MIEITVSIPVGYKAGTYLVRHTDTDENVNYDTLFVGFLAETRAEEYANWLRNRFKPLEISVAQALELTTGTKEDTLAEVVDAVKTRLEQDETAQPAESEPSTPNPL